MADYDIPQNLLYSKEDEWARAEGLRVTIGVTDYAQQQLGDVVFVELPAVGRAVERGEPFGVIESVKTASDLFAPVSGTVEEVNGQIESEPQLVNDAPYEGGWLIKVRPDDAAEIDNLMTAEQYGDQVAGS